MSERKASLKWEEVNAPPEPVSLDVTRCCRPAETSGSPIDAFYDTNAHTLTLGTPEQLQASPTLGRLLILGLVTGVESYFRSLLMGVIEICPLARESISDQMVPLGAIEYYGANQAALGLLEGVSFASESEVKKRTKTILGLSYSENDSVGVALKAYERVCHMRHASVHSQGVLNRGNAKALGIANSITPLHLVIDLPHLHLAAKACMGAVRAYNMFAYQGVLQRWLDNKVLVGNWEIDKTYFGEMHRLFLSKIDGLSKRNSYVAYMSLRPIILKRLSEGSK